MQRASRDFTHIFIINFVQRPGFTKRMGEKKIDKYIEREPHTTFKQRTPPKKNPIFRVKHYRIGNYSNFVQCYT